MLRVNTIYPGFMGEVNYYGIGVPCTFIRLAGCNLRCYKKTKGCLCDTPEALEVTSGERMHEEDILAEVKGYNNRVVCLTGGEPLLQDVGDLLVLLTANGFKVVIETNGSRSIYPYSLLKDVSFVVDVKSKSSGEHMAMLRECNYQKMDEKDVVKFVIDTEEDFNEMTEWLNHYWSDYKGMVAAGLFWGSKMTYAELMDRIHKSAFPIHLNMQTHKMACLYDQHKDDTVKEIIIPKDL